MLINFSCLQEKEEFSENIIQDVATLGITYEKLTHTSDYFPEMLDLAERMVKKGIIYADDTPLEQMRQASLARCPSVTSNCVCSSGDMHCYATGFVTELASALCCDCHHKSGNGQVRLLHKFGSAGGVCLMLTHNQRSWTSVVQPEEAAMLCLWSQSCLTVWSSNGVQAAS